MEYISTYKKNCKKKLVAKVLHIVPEAADDKPLTVLASPIKKIRQIKFVTQSHLGWYTSDR